MLELDIKDEVRDTPAFQRNNKRSASRERRICGQRVLKKMTADWQIAYDMIAKTMDDEDLQDLLRAKLKEKYGQ